MTPQEAIAASLSLFHGAYGEHLFPITEDRARTWCTLLADMEPREILAAASRWAQTQRMPPTPADLLTAIRGRWVTRSIQATDANCNAIPGQRSRVWVLEDPSTGAVRRAVNAEGAEVDPETGRWLRDPSAVDPATLPEEHPRRLRQRDNDLTLPGAWRPRRNA